MTGARDTGRTLGYKPDDYDGTRVFRGVLVCVLFLAVPISVAVAFTIDPLGGFLTCAAWFLISLAWWAVDGIDQ